jgi:hypothetical protein
MVGPTAAARGDTLDMAEITAPPSQDVHALQRQLMATEHDFDAVFRREHPALWWATLVGPFLVTAGVLALLYVAQGPGFVVKLAGHAVAAFFLLGRFVILTGTNDPEMVQIQKFMTSGQLFALVTYMDLFVAVLLAFHTGFLFKVPWLGPKIAALVEDGQFFLQSNRWMRRMAFLGLVAFVLFPLAATGSVGGSIFGRLAGMSRWAIFAGVALGSVIGNGLMYLGNGIINKYLDRNSLVVNLGGLAVILAVVVLLNWRYRRMKARHHGAARRRQAPGG